MVNPTSEFKRRAKKMIKRTSGRKASIDKQKQGYKAALKGKDFEKKVGAFFVCERIQDCL